jgi:hypothetical protein
MHHIHTNTHTLSRAHACPRVLPTWHAGKPRPQRRLGCLQCAAAPLQWQLPPHSHTADGTGWSGGWVGGSIHAAHSSVVRMDTGVLRWITEVSSCACVQLGERGKREAEMKRQSQRLLCRGVQSLMLSESRTFEELRRAASASRLARDSALRALSFLMNAPFFFTDASRRPSSASPAAMTVSHYGHRQLCVAAVLAAPDSCGVVLVRCCQLLPRLRTWSRCRQVGISCRTFRC